MGCFYLDGFCVEMKKEFLEWMNLISGEMRGEIFRVLNEEKKREEKL